LGFSSNKNFKLYLALILFAFSVVGFMMKLPSFFHHFDKELHALFYFCATYFLLLLYPKRWLIIPTSLFVFGVVIEFAQDFSNKISIRIIGKRIHGRFDPEDVFFNLFGIFIGLVVFFLLRGLFRVLKK
jgi:hypothetical protein